MLSFTNLPPEIRMAIYKLLLQSTLAKTTRTLYSGNNPLRCGDTPHCIRHNQPFERTVPGDNIRFLDARIIYARDIERARYNIHHADLDDLLPLASTCRLVRSDLLALVWSRAEIHITSPELHAELRCIFYDRLTSVSCSFIRTLEIDVHKGDWLPSETRKIVGLIRRRLPRLERLTLNVRISFLRDKVRFAPGLAAFRILPPSVELIFNHRLSANLRIRSCPLTFKLWRKSMHRNLPDEPEIVTLDSLRAELSLIGQRRTEQQVKRELEDQVCDILEATSELRSPLPLSSPLPRKPAGHKDVGVAILSEFPVPILTVVLQILSSPEPRIEMHGCYQRP
jgi:hypothetical protein